MTRAVVLAALVAGCGVKAPPRPPARPDASAHAPERPAPPEAAACDACGAPAGRSP